MPDDDLDRLYGVPLGEFTAARNALAGELKNSGDTEGAKRIRELKKPTRSAGAINRAVRERRADARKLLGAAEKMQAAQERMLEGGGRKVVEEARKRERAALDRFMTAVEAELEADEGASRAMLDRARSTLEALAGDPELRRQFEAGRIATDHEAVGFGALSVEPATSRAKAKESRPAEDREAKRRLKQSERELEMAVRRLRRARDRAEKAREQLDAANAAVAEAEASVAEATSFRDAAADAADSRPAHRVSS